MIPVAPRERLRVVFSEAMVADVWRARAPGPVKAGAVAEALQAGGLPVEFMPPEPASRADLHRTHCPSFVDDVLACRRNNAFGTLSDDFARALPLVCGAVYTSARFALEDGLSASLTSGFHHAAYDRPRAYCTFNGLVIAAMRLFAEGRARRIAIVDGDYHDGDGTDALIARHQLQQRLFNLNLGRCYHRPEQADDYLEEFRHLHRSGGASSRTSFFIRPGRTSMSTTRSGAC